MNYQPRLVYGVFNEILSAMYELIMNSAADEGEFEHHRWAYNPYGLYINEKEFESKEEIAKWYRRWEKHRDVIFCEARKALKHLELVGIDARKWLEYYFYGEGNGSQDNDILSMDDAIDNILDYTEGG